MMSDDEVLRMFRRIAKWARRVNELHEQVLALPKFFEAIAKREAAVKRRARRRGRRKAKSR
jgi:hypothetical protein